MRLTCPICRHENPSHARFCGRCGRPLSRRSRGGTGCGLFPGLIIILAIVLWTGGWRGCPGALIGRAGNALWHRGGPNLVKRSFELPPAKADAMFDLLAPQDVKVIVQRRDYGVSITGTPQEADVIQNFVELLLRHEGICRRDFHTSLGQLRNTWTKRETYELPRRQARCLYRLLAFDDVPVRVYGYPNKVIVDATEADQRVLAELVDILRGHRLR